MEMLQSIRSNIFTPPPNTETTFYAGLPSNSCSSAHLAQLAVIILSAMHEAECLRIPNAAAVRRKKEGIYERQRFPSWRRACLAGPHINYTNASQIFPPLLIFFLKYQLKNLKGSFWGGICFENVSRCFTSSLHYFCSKFEEQLS